MRKFFGLLFCVIGIMFGANAFACKANQITIDESTCVDTKFTITTTNIESDSDFGFGITAQGTFYVDWGDGETEVFERENISSDWYSHTYENGGVYTIRMAGLATGYATPNVNQDMTQFTAISFESQPIVAVDGSLGAIFPTLNNGSQPAFVNTFADCYSLTKVPDALFSGVNGSGIGMFASTFFNSGLTTIPTGLFNGVSGAAEGMFIGTFAETPITTIPTRLFRGVTGSASGMFIGTFNRTNIRAIPETLFSGVTGGAESMFEATFSNCSYLTAIPAGLFSGITNDATDMFTHTFSECYNISGYIPPSTFAGLIANGSPYEDYMFDNTFGGTSLSDECPYGTRPYTTNYEAYWDGYVSCEAVPTHTITYVLNGGTNYEDAPTFYWEGIGEIIDGVPTKKDGIFAGWCTDSQMTNCDVEQYIDEDSTNNITLYAKWTEAKFSINVDLTDQPEFCFGMAAAGDFIVDWGDNSVEVFERDDTEFDEYCHIYDGIEIPVISRGAKNRGASNSNVRTIRFAGVATEYPVPNKDDDWSLFSAITFMDTPVISVSGSLGAAFPTLGNAANQVPAFMYTFSDTLLHSVPSTLFNGVTGSTMGMFMETFNGSTLGSIPSGLFNGISGAAEGMFYNTFINTRITSIPSGLFNGVSGAADYMFYGTFEYTPLTSIPSGLFDGVSGAAEGLFGATFAGTYITSIPANLFPNVSGAAEYMFGETFARTYITSIPANLFNGVSGAAEAMFDSTFSNCYNLTSIPANLFSGVSGAADGMFNYTFSDTQITSIPANLFSGVSGAADGLFSGTFSGCYNLTSIPENLFSGVTGGAEGMFSYTFNSCNNLKSIPENLFSGVTDAAPWMFNYTFAWCNNLTGYIPPSTFAGLIENNHPYAESMFYDTFVDTDIFTECPAGTQQYETGYEDYWNNRVSCEPIEVFSRIYYELDEGTNFANAPTTYQEGVALTIDGIPTKEGYIFGGWCWDEYFNDCETPVRIFDTDSGDITLYAKWVSACECGNIVNGECSVIGVAADGKTCQYRHTCYDGYWNINNGEITMNNNIYCEQCSNGSYCPTGAKSEISCSTVGDGSYIYSYEGSSEASGCYRDCRISDVPHSTSVYNQTYYGDNGEYCGANDCINGYFASSCDDNYCYNSSRCIPNEITILWSDTSESSIAFTNAYTVRYGEEIRTPRSATRVPGKKLKGWRFVLPSEVPDDANIPEPPEPEQPLS